MTEGIIEFSDWQKLDLRVGKIIEVENIEGADKLYKITVNLGKETGKRTICAGIKEFYTKEELQDKLIILFTNLKPRTMRGIESQGMLLAAVKEKDGKEIKVVLISPEKDIEIGSKVS